MMSFEINVTEADWIAFQLFNYKRIGLFEKSVRKNRVGIAWSLLIVTGFIAFSVINGTNLVFPLTAVFISMVISFFKARTRIENTYIDSFNEILNIDKNIRVLGISKVHLTEKGLEISDNFSSIRFTKNSIIYTINDNRSVYLFTDEISAIIIPQNSFKKESEMMEFLEELKGLGIVREISQTSEVNDQIIVNL